ncbi:MAG: hypothetical protein P8Y78_05115 [Acidihalobacter sp.]
MFRVRALLAQAVNFDQLAVRLKIEPRSLPLQGAHRRLGVDFLGPATSMAKQQQAIVTHPGMAAGDESVRTAHTMHEPLLTQKLECPIYRRRAIRVAGMAQFVEQFVRTHGFCMIQQQFEDAAPQRRKPRAAPHAQVLGVIQAPPLGLFGKTR